MRNFEQELRNYFGRVGIELEASVIGMIADEYRILAERLEP